MQADGWSLDDKRQPLLPEERLGVTLTQALTEAEHAKNNLPDVLTRWGQRETLELERPRTAQSFCVPKAADIAATARIASAASKITAPSGIVFKHTKYGLPTLKYRLVGIYSIQFL